MAFKIIHRSYIRAKKEYYREWMAIDISVAYVSAFIYASDYSYSYMYRSN